MTTLRKLPMIAPSAKANAGTTSSSVWGPTEPQTVIRIRPATQAAGPPGRPRLDRPGRRPYHATPMARSRNRTSLFAALLAATGIVLVFRYQGPLAERVVARRLAEDLPPDE